MDDIKILEFLEKKCNNDKLLIDFTKELFIEELNEPYNIRKSYDKIIDKYCKKM